MNWLIAENELDPQQRDFLDTLVINGTHKWIEGFPGSGKTILLLYAAKRLKDKNPNTKILFVEFTHSLIKMLKAAINQLPYKDIPVVTYYDFVNHANVGVRYDYILCDEVQDVPRIVLETMRQYSDRVIIAGDANQSIYERDPKWNRPVCTNNDIPELFSPDDYKLNIIHRLTKPIIRAVNSFLPEMNILAGRHPMTKKNVQIRLWHSISQKEEAKHILKEAEETINNGSSVGILLQYHQQIITLCNFFLDIEGKEAWTTTYNQYGKPDFNSLNQYLASNEIPLQYVANGYGDFMAEQDKIVITTYHSSKGLDFDSVFLPFCNANPNNFSFQTKTLFMVAMTRSRENLYISYTGNRMSELVRTFANECNYIDWENEGVPNLFDAPIVQSPQSDTSDDNIFGF